MILPESWIETTLANIIVDLQPGFAQRPGDEDTGSIPQIRTHNVSPEGKLTLEGIKFVTPSENELTKYNLKKGDIVFNNTNSEEWVGKTAIFEEEGVYVFSNHMTRIRANTEIVDARFLASYLHSLWSSGYSKNRSKRWVSQAAIEGKTLSAFKIRVPTLSEQRRIVAILQHIEAFSTNRNLFREQLERTKNQLFYEMFGNPSPLDNQQWDTEILEKNIEVGTGGTPSRENEANYGGSIPWVKSTDLTDTIINETGEYLTEQGLKSSNAKIYPKGTILLAMYGQGQTRGRTGKLAIEAACNQACAALVPNERLNADYLWAWLQNSYDYVRSLGRGGQQANLNLSIIKNIKIPVPPIELQDKFSERLTQILKIENDMNEAIRKSAVLYEQVRVQALLGELTETWRNKNKNQTQIQAEAEARAERLALTAKPRTPEKPPAAAKKPSPAQSRPARLALFGELSEFQQFVFEALKEWPAGILIPDDSAAFEDFCRQWPIEHERNTQDRARRALDQLASLGLIAKVSLPNPQGQYLTAYRMPREGDERRTGDIESVQTAIRRTREMA
jgi:type I restriction enzyme S subunit